MIKATKWAIWLYLILLICEGALRKWIFPQWSSILLIVRDPVLLLIYALALASGKIPQNRFLAAIGVLAVASFIFSLLAGQSNLLVTLYGIRINYLHVPLIWVMAEVLDRDDVERIGTFVLLSAILMTLVMVKQFRSPMDAWINRGIGGDEKGQIYGAMGHIRPPGLFTFITGPLVYFPLVAAFLLHQASGRRILWWPVLAVCGICVVIALPISISRGTMITTGAVGVVFAACLLRLGFVGGAIIRVTVIAAATLIALSFLPIFKDARAAFMDRWELAAEESEGHAWGSLTSRVGAAFTTPLDYAIEAPIFGKGIGVGSNVGSQLMTGTVTFQLAEDEWGKVFQELGPFLGGAFILFRIVLTVYLGFLSWRALAANRDPLPLLLFTACAPAIMLHQWAPPTLLGFAVFGGGLTLASLNERTPGSEEEEDEDEDEEDAENEDDEAGDSADESPEPDEPLSEIEERQRRMRGL